MALPASTESWRLGRILATGSYFYRLNNRGHQTRGSELLHLVIEHGALRDLVRHYAAASRSRLILSRRRPIRYCASCSALEWFLFPSFHTAARSRKVGVNFHSAIGPCVV